jgi:type VI secretion system secreted protein VgrG
MPAAQTVMALTAPGNTGLLFKRMSASESLGRLFEFDVQAVAPSDAVQAEDLLGKPASVAVQLLDGSQRHFHGLVCAMGMEGAVKQMFGYRLVLRPWLWLLTRRSDTRVFQAMTMEDILKKVFQPFSADYQFQLSGTLPQYEYCVQYRETDFDFVSRLLEQEGAYYYFKHEAGKHTMVIVNAPSAHQPGPHQATFEYRETADGHLEFEPITEWRTRKEIQSGQVVLRDYDFTQPKTSLETTAKASRPEASTKLEVYDYPGTYPTKAAGDRYSKLRVEELQAKYVRVDGFGALRGMACGYRFTLAKHPRADQNAAHLVLATQIECAYSGYESGEDETFCTCRFTAIPGSETYRPPRSTPRPSVAGLHTAVVVGPSGEEIHTDAHGRVKVQFYWDRLGKNDDKSSCWVRVASPWAGQGWGAISLPRIGQEVVVDFLAGDPDRPLITGSVYNGEQTPPYALPDNATVSTAKSRSSKGGAAANFNELRFEDKKGSEYVWLQAEKDFHQLVKNDATLEVRGKQERLVTKTLTEKVDGDVKMKVGGAFDHEVTGAASLKATGDVVTESAVSISQKAGTQMDVKIGTNLGVDAGVNVHIKGGVNVVVEAGVMMTLKAGASSVVLGPSGVMITGTMVMINSGGGGGSGSGASPKAGKSVTPPDKKDDPLGS